MSNISAAKNITFEKSRTPDALRAVLLNYGQPLPPSGKGNIMAWFRGDTNPSLHVDLLRGRCKDFGSDFHGSAIDLVMLVDGCDMRTAIEKIEKLLSNDGTRTGGKILIEDHEKQSKVVRLPLTLEIFSREKKIPVDFLASMGVRDSWRGEKCVEFPYPGTDIIRYRIREMRDGTVKDKVVARAGQKQTALYAQPSAWEIAKNRGFILLVEGESDALTLWYANSLIQGKGIPCAAVPGAMSWREDYERQILECGIAKIFVSKEHDRANSMLINRVAKGLIPKGFSILEVEWRHDG